jgi:hypothetical protein
VTDLLLDGAAFMCLGIGIGCWLAGVVLPRGPVASITAMAAFVSAGLALIAGGVWAKFGGGQAWPLVLIAVMAAAVTLLGLMTGKWRGWG